MSDPAPARRQGKTASTTRRPRGEVRRLLLDTARTLFGHRDYRSTTTREIARAAGTTEHLLFRHFGSKAGLFREALVVPFVEFVDGFKRTWRTMVPVDADDETLALHFVGTLYDVFDDHQGLVLTLLTSATMHDDEMADAGIDDVRQAMNVLAEIGSEAMLLKDLRHGDRDLPAHSAIAMIAGMVALRTAYFGSHPPPRDILVDELVRAILHGFLHRPK